ncbi:non-ribosomal peptide synthetase [Micromonospora inaquosa]|uniref:non-ribosomal peptide synthetase n=1 Tax=Micromonospora inaquosa TaxID=2203716 RepID=UPI001315A04D|nr:non-ribosomal peptide synthetase [Micromonospora inaquosa]
MNPATYLDRLASHGRRRPDAVAARFGTDSITYAELLTRARTLALRLQHTGVRRGDPVGLRLPRGLDLLVGMCAIGRAGGVVVPMAPDEPPRRLAAVLADAGITTVIGVGDRDAPDGVTVLRPGSVDVAPNDAALPTVGASDVAYVIYTSGSTGAPKGVPVGHGNLLRYLNWCDAVLLEPGVALPAVSSPAFDASLKQLLGPLIGGGTVWLVDDATAGDPRRIAELLGDAGPSALNCVPAMWGAVLDELAAAGRPPVRLRRLMLGGEALDAELLRRTRAAFPAVDIWNLYGPTEATANATATLLDRDGEVHLGSPIAGARVYVLGPDGAPVADGEAGELYVGGPQLALGYRGDAARTAARFVPDPFTPTRGGRMFRTGDVVRCRGGRLFFETRRDRLVKRAGVRLELGEVESALRALDGVAAAAVVTVGEPARLLAAVVPTGDRELIPTEVRHALTAFLPRAAVPDQVVVLPALPVTAGGKVDAAALREFTAPLDSGPADEAADPVEAVLIGVWQQVIGGKPVASNTDFFDVGGHSLAMLRIVGRVAELLDAELTVDVFYDAPTVAAHADLIREQRGPTAVARARDILAQGDEPASWRAA